MAAREYTVKTDEVLREVGQERARQDAKWGEQNHPDGRPVPDAGQVMRRRRQQTDRAAKEGTLTWNHVLAEEYWEAQAEVGCCIPHLRQELVQLAAVAVAWVECIDRRAGL